VRHEPAFERGRPDLLAGVELAVLAFCAVVGVFSAFGFEQVVDGLGDGVNICLSGLAR